MSWTIFHSGSLPPEAIMAKDATLLQQIDPDGSPILHLYEWEGNCLTYGYFTNPAGELNLSLLDEEKVRIARRPTGGGIIFHLTDFAFSILIPKNHPGYSQNTLQNYAYVNTIVSEVIKNATAGRVIPELLPICKTKCAQFCMAQATQYDLIVDGQKVGGAAQRQTKRGYLHQGTISLSLPPLSILQKVLKTTAAIDQMQHLSYSLLPLLGVDEVGAARELLKKNFTSLLQNSPQS